MFKQDLILPDVLFPYQDHFDIQAWLRSKNCFLENFEVLSHLFSDYLLVMCERIHVNPKLILVSLQREQGMISMHSVPANNVLNRALGVGCTDSGDETNFYGFQSQIDGAIETYKKWFDRKIMPLQIDGKNIMPLNQFTYALYMYTPHLAAAKLTYDIWRGWFPDDINPVIPA